MNNPQRNIVKLMKDPTTAKARIYVGNVEPGTVQQELQDVFKVYGKILRITVTRNFGFVQFESEESAQGAIKGSVNTIFKGQKLNVKAAREGGKGNAAGGGSGGGGGNKRNQQGGATGQQSQQQEQTVTQSQESEPSTQQQQKPQQQQMPQQNLDMQRRGQNQHKRGGQRGGRGGRGGRNNIDNNEFSGRDRSPLHRDSIGEQDFQSQDRNFGGSNNVSGLSGPMINQKKTDCNDCEIIVVDKALTEYAEYIERRLKQLGLSVDLLFPNEDVPIGRVLANIASRGCLYAILITPQNEEHGSLTLNILYGQPQEHRNMPTEDALGLLSRNFDAYMRGDKSLPGVLDRHPEPIQILLNLLAENRQLTVLQYDRIIKYLQERRELQLKNELGDAADDLGELPPHSKQATELQNRILSILNSKADKPPTPPPGISQLLPAGGVVLPGSVDSGTPSTPAPLLNDPSVQKALDSLLNADLLKNIVKPSSGGGGDTFGGNYGSNVRRF